MINKIYPTVQEAMSGIIDNSIIVIGGMGGAGIPFKLIEELGNSGVKDLTVITNSPSPLKQMKSLRPTIKKAVMAYATGAVTAVSEELKEKMRAIERGEIEVEIFPSGTLFEKLRSGGMGIMAFYTPTGVGTEFAEGKESRFIDGRECILENALKPDFALIKANKCDRLGNLVYRYTAANYNPVAAMSAKITIVEVEEIVQPGELDPSFIHTPGIFVDRIVKTKIRKHSFMASKNNKSSFWKGFKDEVTNGRK